MFESTFLKVNNGASPKVWRGYSFRIIARIVVLLDDDLAQSICNNTSFDKYLETKCFGQMPYNDELVMNGSVAVWIHQCQYDKDSLTN
jgi:cytidylate kinase